jgi:hypothetical protein
MPNLFRKLSSQSRGRPIRSLVFFILFYLYLWLEVNPQFIYHGGGMIANFPSFFRGWAFFHKFTSYPGGPVEYLTALLSQSFYISWAGALAITLQAWLICLCIDYFLKIINAPHLYWVRFVPPILLLTTYTQYTYQFLNTTAFLASLLFVCLYLKIVPKNKLAGLVIFLVLFVILYYIAAGAYLLFAVLCAAYELFWGRRWQLGLVYLLLAAVIPYVGGVLLFNVSIIDAFSNLLPFSWKTLQFEPCKRMVIMVYILYLLLPLTTLGLGLWQTFMKKKIREKSPAGILSRYTPTPILKWFIELCVLFAIAGAAVLYFHDKKVRTWFEVDYYACHKMWPEVLHAASNHPDDFYVVHAVNRALYHTGRLAFDMFSYPQHPDTLFLTAEQSGLVLWKKFDICIELGIINVAENALVIYLEVFGERPILLERLALINMVKGNSGAARVYLGALSKTLFHSEWANNYLIHLESDPNFATDEWIEQLRNLMVEKDGPFGDYSPENILLALLEKDRQNRMAIEYLMALYLLTGKLDKFTENLNYLDDLGYSEIPRHYEEAILVYNSLSEKSVNLRGRQLSPESHQRFEGFFETFNRYGGNNKAAFNELAKNYGDSYFFYYTYGVSGMKK